MAKAAKAKTEEGEGGKSGGKGKKLLLIIIVAVVLAGAGGGAAWWFLMGPGGEETGETTEAKKKEPTGPPVFSKPESFTVNLQGGGSYLQLTLVMHLADAAVEARVAENLPAIRSELLLLLSTQHAQAINSVAGKKALAEMVQRTVNEILHVTEPGQGVVGVYFTSFVIQ